jgi:multicomponent K+:H+ antiporter subunit G
MITAVEILVAALLVIGGLFGVVGSWGLLRLKDRMQRLHAPTKATTVGVGTALIALAFEVWLTEGRFAWREALVAVFFFATAPLSAIYMAKAHLHRSVPRASIPPTGTPSDWATFTPDDKPLTDTRG